MNMYEFHLTHWQDGCQFPDDIFKYIFLNENMWIPMEISLKFVLKGPINHISALVQIMAWCRPGDKPLSEPIVVSSLMYVCVTWLQWVKLLPYYHITISSKYILLNIHTTFHFVVVISSDLTELCDLFYPYSLGLLHKHLSDQNFNHWLHWKLPKSHFTVQSVMQISKLSHFCFRDHLTHIWAVMNSLPTGKLCGFLVWILWYDWKIFSPWEAHMLVVYHTPTPYVYKVLQKCVIIFF